MGSTAAKAGLPGLAAVYREVRDRSLALCRTLETEDYVVQSMPSVSPVKWHLAHTTWFFERFVLTPLAPGYEVLDPAYDYLFNSYYQTVGRMHPRPERGLLSRPTVEQVRAYRRHVDKHVLELLAEREDAQLGFLVELGLNHEEQHQELMLTDIKHVFSVNPLKPRLVDAQVPRRSQQLPPLEFVSVEGGLREIGAPGDGFCFDNETPRHRVWLDDFALANRLVTNREYREFITDRGYEQSHLWLSDGWVFVNEQDIRRPLYWDEALEREYTLSGMRELDPDAPVSHVSLYEADAFARWAGARLPTEAEWEVAVADAAVTGNLLDSGLLHPQPLAGEPDGIAQLFGDTWEWTASAYAPYPGFAPLAGSLGEYNGKFMCNQMVCRGGSCVTPPGHVRASYRNFFYPGERWQFFGIRLARTH